MIDEGLIYELREFCDTKRIQEIVDKIDEQNNINGVKPLVEELQTMNNALYEQIGINTVILDFQCYINSLYNTYDIHDKREIINDEGFVQ